MTTLSRRSTLFLARLSVLLTFPILLNISSGMAFQQGQKVQLPPLPLSPIEQAEHDGTALTMSLRDLTKVALQNNLDIAISDTNEMLYQQRVMKSDVRSRTRKR